MLMQPITDAANSVFPVDGGSDNPLFRRGPDGYVKDRQIEAFQMTGVWMAITCIGVLIFIVVAGAYNLVAGHRSFAIDTAFFGFPVFGCAGVFVQAIRGMIAGALVQLPLASSPTYMPPRPLRWLLTTHDSDLLIQAIATALVLAFLASLGPAAGEQAPF